MFAAIVILSVIGVTGSAVLRTLHRRLIFWEQTKHTAIESPEK
jgi:ABC-type nitrate/sulfonate/bicarbonate transport system permease component